jgi:putative PEP-CTERM system TPR-repeat lipoprotein
LSISKELSLMNIDLRGALLSVACVIALSGCGWFVSVEDRIERAEAFINQGEERAAAIELQNALKSEPDNVRARLLLAEVSLRQGDPEAAADELERAVASGAPAGDVASLGVEIRLAKGEHAALLADLDAGKVALDASQTATYRGLAQLASRNLPAATAAFNEALEADPASTRARLGFAEARALAGDFDVALAEIGKVLAVRPTDAHALSLKGRILGQQGDFDDAAAALGTARKNAAGQLTVLEYNTLLSALVEAYLASGEVKASRDALNDLAGRLPTAPLVQLLSARIAMAEQNYQLAVNEAQKVVAVVPNHPMAKLILGAALLANGNYHQAEAQLSELVSQAPENLEARKLLADANLRLQRPDVAMQVLAPAQQSSQSDAQVETLLAWANLQRGDEGAAIELLKRSIASRPDNEGLKLDLALALVMAGRNQEAIEVLDSLPASRGSGRREQLLITAIGVSKTPQTAKVQVEEIVKANAGDVGVLSVAANFYARNRDYARARELLAAARALDPKDTSSLSSLARLEMAAGDDAAASTALQSLLKLDPANRQARIFLAQIALRANDTGEASEQLETARSAEPEAVVPRLLLASVYLRERKTAEADAVLRELDALAEKNPAVAAAAGRVYAAAGRYEEAFNQFRSAARGDPKNPAWLLEMARVQIAREDRAGARNSVDKALALDPDSVAANASMIGIELKEGRKDQALARATRLRKAHPQDADAAMVEGDVHLTLRNAPAAARSFADAYALAPSSGAALRVYQARSILRASDATAILEDWLQREPQDLAVRLVFAQSLLARGRHADAITQYERAVQAGRPGAMALNNLAWLYQQAKDPRAETTARQAYELAPDSSAVGDTYGWILVEAGRAQDALPILERAVKAPDANPEMRFHYAVALARGGRPEEAGTALRKLLAEPGFGHAAEARELLKELGISP